jgi:hypothetical protein
MYKDEKESLYDYVKYKYQKTNSKANNIARTESGITTSSNGNSSINNIIINSNKNNEKIDLSKYMYMFVTFFVNRVSLNIFLDNGRQIAQLILDEFFLLFKQRMDMSSKMGLHVRNIEMFSITEKNDREVIVSDFSQLINQYDDNDNDSIDRKNKNPSISGGSSGGRKSSSDFEEIMDNLNVNQ